MDGETMTTTTTQPALAFRNYVPKHESLRAYIVKIQSIPSRQVEVQLNEAKMRAKTLSGEDKPVLVAPKRANWDLKRDAEKRLKRLSKRTQQAITQLAEQLQREKEEEEQSSGE